MVDRVSKEARSRMMSAVRGKDTKPEKHVRSRLFSDGFRFRLHAKELPGKPDIVLPRYGTAIFVHGCFWHGHDCPRGRRPKSNRKFWNRKLDGNIKRDQEKKHALEAGGWYVEIVWGCRLETDLKRVLRKLRASKRSKG